MNPRILLKGRCYAINKVKKMLSYETTVRKLAVVCSL